MRQFLDRMDKPRVDEIQAQHAHQHIEQGANHQRRLAATPQGRERQHADQIVDAARKASDLLGGRFARRLHARPPAPVTCS